MNELLQILYLILKDDYSENLDTESTKTLSLRAGTSTASTQKTFSGSLCTNGNVSLRYGTFNLSNIECKTFTSATTSTVEIETDLASQFYFNE